MIVRSLRLRNFRNYALQEVDLPPGLIALTGDNGQGKTNLLEALCVLATTKSPLVDRDRELIRWDTSEARIAAEVELSARRADVRRLEYAWKVEPNGKSVSRELKAGGVPQSAVAQWLGQLQVVAFFPHDLAILSGEPDGRRRFLNLELGKTRPAHFADAARYRRALQQRNALLRHLAELGPSRARASGANTQSNFGTLAEWNRQLVTYGSRVLEQRAAFLRELAPFLAESHRTMSGREELLELEYAPGVRAPDGDFMQPGYAWSALFGQTLEDDHETDLRRGSTTSGPHRDDFSFKLGGMELRRYGSQGQGRLAVLSLKLSLARWVEQATGEAPILLLDDALSELDETRRARLLEDAKHFPQSVLTATDDKFLAGATTALFRVEAGKVKTSS